MPAKKSTGIIPALLFISIVLVAVFYVSPLRNKLLVLEESVSEKKTDLSNLEKELKQLEKFQADLPQDIASINRKIPVDLKEDELILLIETIALENNISFSSLGFSPGSRERGKVSPVVISSSFEGTYKDLLRFIQALERAKERKFVVRSISVSLSEPKQEGVSTSKEVSEIKKVVGKYLESPLIASFTIQLEAYYQGLIR